MLQDFVCLFAKNLEQGLIIILKFTLNVLIDICCKSGSLKLMIIKNYSNIKQINCFQKKYPGSRNSAKTIMLMFFKNRQKLA